MLLTSPSTEFSDAYLVRYWRDQICQTRYNTELYEIFSDPIVFIVVKVLRLQWICHVDRKNELRLPKQISESGAMYPERPRLKVIQFTIPPIVGISEGKCAPLHFVL